MISIVIWAKAKQLESQEIKLIADAAPLADIRDKAQHLRGEIGSLELACALVESAKPNDDLLQSLAAMTVATESIQEDLRIESLDMRLPLETPREASTQLHPKWADAELAITANFNNPELLERWLQQIRLSDRILDVVVQENGNRSGEVSINAETTIMATPVATRMLP